MVAEETKTDNRASFESDVSEVLTRLRAAVAEVISALPESVGGGADLHRALKIDRNLSWRLFKVASAVDLMAAGQHVPRPAKLSAFLKAAGKRGVPKRLIESVSHIAADFEEVVTTHAGDHTTFESMLSALADDESAEQIDLVHRRLAFRGQRHIVGAYARTKLKFIAMQPSEKDPSRMDGIRVEGFIDLRGLRGGVPLAVFYSGARNDDGSPLAMRWEPLEPETGSDGLALLRGFCSQPLPELRTVETGSSFAKGELVAGDVGNLAAITCFEGHKNLAALPRYGEEGNRFSGSVVTVRTPCEVLVLDLLVHKDTYGPLRPTPIVHSEHLGEPLSENAIQRQRYSPGGCSVHYLGRGPSVLHSSDVPRYAELGRYVFERAGWSGDKFDVYRCRMEYPIMPSVVALRFDLPEAPTEG